MSRYINQDNVGNYTETISNMNECRWMYDDVCCNDESDCVADYPDEETCRKCELFTKEDGKI